MRNIFKEDKDNNFFLTYGAKNNEEIKLWTYVLDKGNKFIIDECMHVYRHVEEEGTDNYCSRVGFLGLFLDYYKDIKVVEKIYGRKYNFVPFKSLIINKYLLILGNDWRECVKILKSLSCVDLFNLLLYKSYLKLHHYQKPEKWKRKGYIVK